MIANLLKQYGPVVAGTLVVVAALRRTGYIQLTGY